MKSLYLKTLIAALAMSSITSAALASVGNGSGNGDGDSAFALQKLAASNPGLTPSQVLLKAFQESAGRVPSIGFQISSMHDTLSDQFNGILFGWDPTSLQRRTAEGIEFVLSDNGESAPLPVTDAFSFTKTVPRLGPLLQPQTGEVSFIDQTESSYRTFAVYGKVSNSGQSLVLNQYIGTKTRNPVLQPWAELRSYNGKAVVFIVHPVRFANGTLQCISVNAVTKSYEAKQVSDICTVGYFWTN